MTLLDFTRYRPSLNIVTLRVRASPYELGGNTIQPIEKPEGGGQGHSEKPCGTISLDFFSTGQIVSGFSNSKGQADRKQFVSRLGDLSVAICTCAY